MKRRRCKPVQKALIVLEGLKGRPIGELCANMRLAGPVLPLARPVPRQRPESVRAGRRPTTQGRLERENARLKALVGELTLKLKKSEEVRQGRRARNAALLERIREIKAEHPFWGYRRIWAYLRYVDGCVVNQKRVCGIIKAHDLLVKPNLKLRARRGRHHETATDRPQ